MLLDRTLVNFYMCPFYLSSPCAVALGLARSPGVCAVTLGLARYHGAGAVALGLARYPGVGAVALGLTRCHGVGAVARSGVACRSVGLHVSFQQHSYTLVPTVVSRVGAPQMIFFSNDIPTRWCLQRRRS